MLVLPILQIIYNSTTARISFLNSLLPAEREREKDWSEGLGEISPMFINSWWESAEKMEPGSIQWCPVTGPEKWAQTERQEVSSENLETYFMWWWPSAGTSCPGRSWNLLIWRCSKAIWKQSSAISFRWPWLNGMLDKVTSRGLFQSQLFCYSVITEWEQERTFMSQWKGRQRIRQLTCWKWPPLQHMYSMWTASTKPKRV